MVDGNLPMANMFEFDVDPIDLLISKYEKIKEDQITLQKTIPLSNAVFHQLLDQNIHIFEGIIKDLNNLIN